MTWSNICLTKPVDCSNAKLIHLDVPRPVSIGLQYDVYVACICDDWQSVYLSVCDNAWCTWVVSRRWNSEPVARWSTVDRWYKSAGQLGRIECQLGSGCGAGIREIHYDDEPPRCCHGNLRPHTLTGGVGDKRAHFQWLKLLVNVTRVDWHLAPGRLDDVWRHSDVTQRLTICVYVTIATSSNTTARTLMTAHCAARVSLDVIWQVQRAAARAAVLADQRMRQ